MLSEYATERGWDIRYDQLEKGRFRGVVDSAIGRDTVFFRDRYDRALVVHGAVPVGVITVILPPQTRAPSTFCGTVVSRGTLCLMTPGDQGALRTHAGCDQLNLCIASARLDQALQSLCQTSLVRSLPSTCTMVAGIASVARLQAAAELAMVVAPSGEVTDGSAAARAAEELAIAALCEALDGDKPPRSDSLAARNHWRCVRAVRDYVEDHLGGSLGIEVLCRVSKVSARTLTTAFQQVTGTSPAQFVRYRRLCAARHLLATGRGTGLTVKEVALESGFWHLGRFARDYREHFGECPSQTLGPH